MRSYSWTKDYKIKYGVNLSDVITDKHLENNGFLYHKYEYKGNKMLQIMDATTGLLPLTLLMGRSKARIYIENIAKMKNFDNESKTCTGNLLIKSKFEDIELSETQCRIIVKHEKAIRLFIANPDVPELESI